jgi:23S rRNA (cytosine1962-C5)-methyltransferase
LALTGFKHVGVFPEQAANWDFIYDTIREMQDGEAGKTDPPPAFRLLNLFAYTGGATLAARSAGADVTHVDSVKQTVSWARDNAALSGLGDMPGGGSVRWIVDDALKFVRREVRRASLYDGIVLDPPAYGRGPDGEKWVLEQNLDEMLENCALLLKPRGFLVLNLYSMGLSALVARTAVHTRFGVPPREQYGELCFSDRAGKQLPLGVYYRFTR